MTPYGKTAQTAVAAVSCLAEVYDPRQPRKLSSAEIANQRNLPQPIVAKVLTVLSQAGIVQGTPGPGGGYWLAQPPEQLTLYAVVALFERLDQNGSCPFGPNYCGNGPHCPLHHQMSRVIDELTKFLTENTFAGFVDGTSPKSSRR